MNKTLKENFIKSIGEENVAKIKDFFAKFQAEVAQTAPPADNSKEAQDLNAPAQNQVTLQDGSVLIVDGDLAVGSKVSVLNTDGSLAVAPDGEYTTQDGQSVVVMNGLIQEVATAAEEAQDQEAPMAMAELVKRLEAIESKFAAIKKENSDLKTELSEVKNSAKVAFSAVNSILEAPVEDAIEKSIDWKDLSPLEKHRLAKK